jgi:hypothetical protein
MRVIARMNDGARALQVTGLVEELDADRFDHRLWTGSVGPGRLTTSVCELRTCRTRWSAGWAARRRRSDDLRALHQLHAAVRAFQPHIVHTHTAKAGVLGRVAARAAGVPAVVHTFPRAPAARLLLPVVTAGVVQVERVLARVSTRLVAVGEQVRDDLLAAGIGRPRAIRRGAPGIALPSSPPRERARVQLGLPPDAPVVVLVAPADRHQAALALPSRWPGGSLTGTRPPSSPWSGKGSFLPELTTAAPVNVRFLGWRADVEVVYAAADLAVLTLRQRRDARLAHRGRPVWRAAVLDPAWVAWPRWSSTSAPAGCAART